MKTATFLIISCFVTILVEAHNNKSRIFYGEFAKAKQFPFQVQILITTVGYLIRCTGSIIKPDCIVTAGHCLDHPDIVDILVFAGYIKETSTTDHTDIVVDKYVKHKKTFTSDGHIAHDIAILKLKNELEFSEDVQPIELSEISPKIGTNCSISGWGTTEVGGSSKQLLYTFITIFNWKECYERFKQMPPVGEMYIHKDALCAGDIKGRKDSGRGDSGGPLVCNNKLSGIVSWGVELSGYPGVYTDISKHLDWIEYSYNGGSGLSLRSFDQWDICFSIFNFNIYRVNIGLYVLIILLIK